MNITGQEKYCNRHEHDIVEQLEIQIKESGHLFQGPASFPLYSFSPSLPIPTVLRKAGALRSKDHRDLSSPQPPGQVTW